jgi:hypothetical protein
MQVSKMIDPTAANNSRLVELFAAADADDAAAIVAAEEAAASAIAGDAVSVSDLTDPPELAGALPAVKVAADALASSSPDDILPSPRDSGPLQLSRSSSSGSFPVPDSFQSDADPTYSYCQVRFPRLPFTRCLLALVD